MLFRSALLSAGFWALCLLAARLTVVPPESCGADNPEALQVAADNAVAWMIRNQGEDGRYVYLYHADSDTTPNEYNEVRHAGVTMSLYQAAGRLHNGDAFAAADKGMEWMRTNLQRHDAWAALAPGGRRASLGASALMLVSLNERRLATGDTQYDELMHELASFVVALQRDDGGFHIAYDITAGEPDTEGTSRYFPGEALWALALTHEAFPGEDWDQYALRALDFVTLRRDDVENVDFPPLADQWAAYGLSEMVEWGLSDEHINYAERLAARFGLLVRTESQREGSWYGRALRVEDSRASGVGTWAEGLAGLWRVSARDERLSGLKPTIKERLQCVAGILADRQVTEEAAQSYPRPDLAAGAWFKGDETRMDDQQHAFSGILYALDAIHDNPIREPAAAPLPGALQ